MNIIYFVRNFVREHARWKLCALSNCLDLELASFRRLDRGQNNYIQQIFSRISEVALAKARTLSPRKCVNMLCEYVWICCAMGEMLGFCENGRSHSQPNNLCLFWTKTKLSSVKVCPFAWVFRLIHGHLAVFSFLALPCWQVIVIVLICEVYKHICWYKVHSRWSKI